MPHADTGTGHPKRSTRKPDTYSEVATPQDEGEEHYSGASGAPAAPRDVAPVGLAREKAQLWPLYPHPSLHAFAGAASGLVPAWGGRPVGLFGEVRGGV